MPRDLPKVTQLMSRGGRVQPPNLIYYINSTRPDAWSMDYAPWEGFWLRFTEKATEAQREVTCPRPHSCKWQSRDLNPGRIELSALHHTLLHPTLATVEHSLRD